MSLVAQFLRELADMFDSGGSSGTATPRRGRPPASESAAPAPAVTRKKPGPKPGTKPGPKPGKGKGKKAPAAKAAAGKAAGKPSAGERNLVFYAGLRGEPKRATAEVQIDGRSGTKVLKYILKAGSLLKNDPKNSQLQSALADLQRAGALGRDAKGNPMVTKDHLYGSASPMTLVVKGNSQTAYNVWRTDKREKMSATFKRLGVTETRVSAKDLRKRKA